MAARETTPLILFSGLAADATVFDPQKQAFPQLIVPGWPVPLPADTLDSYCERLAEGLRPHGRGVIGGASFGGIVAQHVAVHLHPQAVVLIGSVRAPAELPRYLRFARYLRPLIRWMPVRLLQLCCAPAALPLVQRAFPNVSSIARQFRGSDPTVFKWSLARILDWDLKPEVTCPVFDLHGDRDFILPLRGRTPDRFVAGGGHLLSLTHPMEVNAFLRWALTQVVREPVAGAHSELNRDMI